MKKEQGENPEEKKLVWKLKELPTPDQVASLVETEVITPEEGREMLFREQSKTDEVEALKEMVNTLQEMVKDLLARPNNVQLVPYTKVVEVPQRYGPIWMKTLGNGSGTITMTSGTSGYNGTAAYTLTAKQ